MVHCVHKLMYENKRTNAYKSTQHTPQPVIACSKAVWYVSTFQFITYSTTEIMIPYQGKDAQSDWRKQ